MSLRKSPNWIVTGAAGHLGNALYAYLLSQGESVVGIDRRPEKLSPDRTANEIIKLNLEDATDFLSICGENTKILHFGSEANISESLENPSHHISSTVNSTLRILEVAKRAGARVVYPSSGSVFSKENKMPVSENASIGPSSPYSAAKLAAEAICMSYRDSYDMDIRIARIFSVYGPEMRRLFIYDAIKKIKNAKNSRVIFGGSGAQARDYVYIDDFVRATCDIASGPYRAQDFNVGSGVAIKISEIAEKIKTLIGKDLKIEFDLACQKYQHDVFFAENSKLLSTGFRFSTTLDDGLRKTVDGILQSLEIKKVGGKEVTHD